MFAGTLLSGSGASADEAPGDESAAQPHTSTEVPVASSAQQTLPVPYSGPPARREPPAHCASGFRASIQPDARL